MHPKPKSPLKITEEPECAQYSKVFPGDYLMKVGLDAFTWHYNTSTVIELTAVK